MKKSKGIETLDRLSELPDSLILYIFGFLPMRYVIATTVLSKRWRNLWTTTPYLDFSEFGSEDAKFITWSLMFWRGSKILKLKIDSSFTFTPYKYSDIDLWLRFAKDREVQDLCLVAPSFMNDEKYPVPQYLFSSCPSLQVLTLIACNVQIQRNVRWNKLRSLDIYSEDGFSHDTINRILLGSPQLESLVLKFMDADEDLTIRSTSLKKLWIERRIWTDEPVPQTRLTVYAPNLETFKIKYAPYKYCSLENVSSLSHISLCYDDEWEDFLHQQIKYILPFIQRVENVSLSDCCVKVLLSLRNMNLAPRLFYAKVLKLTSSFSDHKQTAYVLGMFPRLETIVLEDVNVFERESHETTSYFDFQPSLPNLTRVEVEWGNFVDDSRIFILIEILFKHASSLETMEFRVMGNSWHPTPPNYLDLVLERLWRMQRASTTAKLDVCQFNIP